MTEKNKRFSDSFEQMQQDVDKYFDSYTRMRPAVMTHFSTRWSPPCNVYDAGDTIRVLVEVAGVRYESIDLTLHEDKLILRGDRSEPDPPARNYLRMEIDFGEFELEVPLPEPVDIAKSNAHYDNGFLLIVLPKVPSAAPHKMKVNAPGKKG